MQEVARVGVGGSDADCHNLRHAHGHYCHCRGETKHQQEEIFSQRGKGSVSQSRQWSASQPCRGSSPQSGQWSVSQSHQMISLSVTSPVISLIVVLPDWQIAAWLLDTLVTIQVSRQQVSNLLFPVAPSTLPVGFTQADLELESLTCQRGTLSQHNVQHRYFITNQQQVNVWQSHQQLTEVAFHLCKYINIPYKAELKQVFILGKLLILLKLL